MQRTPLEALKELSQETENDTGLLSVLRRTNKKQKRQKKTDRLLDRLREPAKKGQKHSAGTLIIASRSSDGVIVGSDRRVVRGTESQQAEKVITVELGGKGAAAKVVVAAEGLTGVRDDFFLLLEGEITRRKGVDTLYEVKVIVEDIIHELTTRYAERLGEPSVIGVVMGGLERLTSGGAKIYYIHGEGYGELSTFVCTGHGGPYALSLAKFLCDAPTLSTEDVANRAAFVISWVSLGELDSSVGGKPQICIFKDGDPVPKTVLPDVIQAAWDRAESHQRKLDGLFGLI
jgi:20S proteasome alpha/beta subunit